jgi:hypothetical protein
MGVGQEPPQRGRYDLTRDEIANRYARLDRIGRRCEGNNRTCWANAATKSITVRRMDPGSGQPIGNSYTVLSCSRHMKLWERRPEVYRWLDTEQLPPRQRPARSRRRRESGSVIAVPPD